MILYDVMVPHILFYGSEIWILKKSQIRSMEAAEIRFLISVRVVTPTDHITSETIRQDLGIADGAED